MDTRGLNETGSGRMARLFALATAFALTAAVVSMMIATGSAKASYTADLGQYAPNGNVLGLGASSTFKAKKPKRPKKRDFYMSEKLALEVTALTAEEIATNSTPSSLFPELPELQGSQWAQIGTGDCTRKSKSRVSCIGGVISSELAPNEFGTQFVCVFPVDVWHPRAVKKTVKRKVGDSECGFADVPVR